jgi:hypothetical protein
LGNNPSTVNQHFILTVLIWFAGADQGPVLRTNSENFDELLIWMDVKLLTCFSHHFILTVLVDSHLQGQISELYSSIAFEYEG